MPKVTRSSQQRLQDFQAKFPGEFKLNSNGELECSLCFCLVNSSKISNVSSHRAGKKHQQRLIVRDSHSQEVSIETSSPVTSSLTTNVDISTSNVDGLDSNSESEAPVASQDNVASCSKAGVLHESYFPSRSLSERVARAFLACDIPLKNLRKSHMQQLFLSMDNPAPSETTCRRKTKTLANEIHAKIKSIVEKSKNGIFVVFDESSMDGISYACTLIGTVENPSVAYLVSVKELESSLNAQITSQLIDDELRRYNIKREKVLLFLSDAATYMVKAGEILHNFYPKMTHVKCMSHLLHNSCMKIRSRFPEIDNLVASVKAATRKNKGRKELFKEKGIPIPPAPVITRWGSWLKAAFYYAKHLRTVQAIFYPITGGKLVQKAQEALRNPEVFSSLTTVFGQYSSIVTVFEKEIGVNFTIEKAHKLFEQFDFGQDICEIKTYLSKRLEKNGLTKIVGQELTNLNPNDYAFLLKCQATSVSVERAFSMLKNINAQDRNFKKGNLEEYLLCNFNAQIL